VFSRQGAEGNRCQQPVGGKAAPQRRKFRTRSGLFGAVRSDDQERVKAEAPGEIFDGGERRAAGPVQVLQNEERRTNAGKCAQGAEECLEQPRLFALCIERRKRIGDVQCVDFRQHGAERSEPDGPQFEPGQHRHRIA
jgi:hypothetical protein